MVLNHVVIIVLLGWDVRSSSLVSVVRRVSGLKRRPPWGIGMDGILRVGISHSIMAIGMWSIGRALRILVGGGGGVVGTIRWARMLGGGRRDIVVLMVLITHGGSGRQQVCRACACKMPNLVTSSTYHQTIGGAKTSAVPRRSGVSIRAFCLLQLFDVFLHFR